MKAQYGILRFAKYKGPEISHIEAHNERSKEKYASNPDVDLRRSKDNIHLISPGRKYRAEAERQIAEAGCRTRSDNVRVVEALITASPEFFSGKSPEHIREYFSYALEFMEKHQARETMISAAIHMDEKTPHMHLCFVPLTADKRLSAKEILGNKKKLTWWQDEFFKHMVEKYPELERGESASKTGRSHIPPRLFKEAVQLSTQREQIMQLMADTNPFNKKAKAEELELLLDIYMPGVEAMSTKLKSYDKLYEELLEKKAQLEESVATLSDEGFLRGLELKQTIKELDKLRKAVEGLPPELLQAAKSKTLNKNRQI